MELMDTKGYLSILPLSVCLSVYLLPSYTYLSIHPIDSISTETLTHCWALKGT